MTANSIFVLIGMILALGFGYLYSAVLENSKRLKKIEKLLEHVVGPEGLLSGKNDPEVIALVRADHISKATKLYRERYEVSLREAELAIREVKNSLPAA